MSLLYAAMASQAAAGRLGPGGAGAGRAAASVEVVVQPSVRGGAQRQEAAGAAEAPPRQLLDRAFVVLGRFQGEETGAGCCPWWAFYAAGHTLQRTRQEWDGGGSVPSRASIVAACGAYGCFSRRDGVKSQRNFL